MYMISFSRRPAMSRKTSARKQQNRQRQEAAECDRLLNELHDMLDRDPSLEHLRAITPPRPGSERAAQDGSRASELFATGETALSADGACSLPLSEANCSPGSQVSASGGELIAPPGGDNSDPENSKTPSQIVSMELVAPEPAADSMTPAANENARLIRHGAEQPGEQFDATQIPARLVRRGRPLALDEQSQGRLLGLMAFGLSFRQAAAQLGVHHQTILNTMKRDAEFAQQVAESRLDAISQPLLTVVRASRTNWRAAAWLARFLEERRVHSYENTPEEREIERGKRS
jgi:hypothetical protein